MKDPKSKKGVGAGGPQGVVVPAKGDSSASNPQFDPVEGATISDAPPPRPQSPPPAKPNTRVVPPDATISGDPPPPPRPQPPSTPAKPDTRVVPSDATISDAPQAPPTKPNTRVVPPDATISDEPSAPLPSVRPTTRVPAN